MSNIVGIIQKITLNPQYPVSVWLDKTSLLAIYSIPASDAQVIQYIEDLQTVISHSVALSNNAPTSYFYESSDATEIFVFIEFTDQAQWDAVNSSQEMQKYQASKKIVYDALGWEDHGYKVIPFGIYVDGTVELNHETGIEEIAGVSGARNIWNFF